MDYEKIAQEETKVSPAIKCFVSGNSILADIAVSDSDNKGTASRALQNCLDAEIDSPQDLAIKKIMAAAAAISKAKGGFPSLPTEPIEAASLIDDTFARLKTSYQVGKGLIDPEKAIDSLVDSAAARASALIDKMFDSGMVNKVLTDGIVKAAYLIPKIGPVIGPVIENCQPIISALISNVEVPVKKFIKEGINKVATTAKSIIQNTVEQIKTTAINLANRVTNLANRVLSLA